MLDRLKVVYGAVHERALLSVLSHVRIANGRMQATDGRMSIDAPFPELEGIEAVAPADRFLSAIEGCEKEPKIIVKDNTLSITSGNFRARVPIMPLEAFPHATPNNPDWELEDPLLPTLKRLRPFVATDATNIWSTSILLTPSLAVATNNVCLLAEECTMLVGTGIEAIAVPVWALDEIIRMGEECTAFGVSDNSITFYFKDTWIKTQLINAQWPIAKVSELYASVPKKLPKIPEGFRSAVSKVTPFARDDKFPVIILGPDGVSTEDFQHSAQVSGITLPNISFNAKMLGLVVDRADCFAGAADQRAVFSVGEARGLIMGLRL